MAQKSILTLADFGRKANIIDPPHWSPILDVAVPRSQAWLIETNSQLKLRIPTAETFEAEGDGTVIYQLQGAIIDCPHVSDEVAIKAYDKTAGKYLEIRSVDYENKTVEVEGNVSGNEVTIYFPFADGALRMAVVAPMGMAVLEMPIFNYPLSFIHGINQYLGTSGLKINPPMDELLRQFGGVVIPEQFRFQLQVKSKTRVTLDTQADNYMVEIPYRFAPYAEMPQGIKQAVLGNMVQLGGR